MASLTTLALSAPKKIRSPSCAPVSSRILRQHFVRQVLHDRRLQAVTALGLLVDLDVGQALGAVDGDELGVGVDFRTRHRTALRHAQADHAAAFHVGGAVEDLELDRLHQFGQFGELELDAHVRLVRTVHAHGGGEVHHRERVRQVDVGGVLEDDAHHVFEQVTDFLFGQERGFAVDLGEFRLAVGAQVFVAEALGDLVVTVEVGDHQQLLEQLRRLRQREEVARVDARRHQVVARAFRGRLGQHRGFDVDEAQVVEVLAHFHRHFVAQAQVVLHLAAAQVEHAVRQAGRFRQVVVVQLERHRHRGVQHFDGAGVDFDLARFQVGVDRAFEAVGHGAGDAQAVLVTHVLGGLEDIGVVRMADDLHQAFTVAQVDEDHPAVVAAAVYPAAQADGLAQQFFGDEAAVVSTHGGHIFSIPGWYIRLHRPRAALMHALYCSPLRDAYSGATTPIETMYLSAASTVMFSSTTLLRSIIRKKPEVGFGVVGTYTLT